MAKDPIGDTLESVVNEGALAGAVTLAWQGGRVMQTSCAGWRDVEARIPMQRDTLFRIASMSKPITSTVALQLFEEGRFALDDPIDRWAPEFAAVRVLKTPDGALNDTVPATRPISFADLLTHRSGITHRDSGFGPISTAYNEALGGAIDSRVAPDEWIARLAALPLIDQPGHTLHYGHSTDLLGFLIARIEDAPLGDVLQRRIFSRLGMKDTGFVVPTAKKNRRAGLYGFDEAGRPEKRLTCPGGSTVAERPEDMTFVSGGQGLWSSADDYLAFARMFVGRGTVDGVQVLRPETLALMTRNSLTAEQRASGEVVRMKMFARRHGFGLGVAVMMESGGPPSLPCGGPVGAVGWPGAFGGWWRADAASGSVLVFLAHNLLKLEQFAAGIGLGVYGAIEKFQELAASLQQQPRSVES